MFPQFFLHKYKEVLSVLQIIRGKLTGDKEMRIQGVNNVLKAMKEERQTYLQEKREAQKEKLYDQKLAQGQASSADKVIRESGNNFSLP